jgi:hypothetical protein
VVAVSLTLALNVARWRRNEAVVAAVVITAHVALVWRWRFDGSLAVAWGKGAVGFIVFHLAWGLSVGAAVAPEWLSRRLLIVAFPVVSAGAIGAVFKYDDVQAYRWPVIAIAVIGLAVLVRNGARRTVGSERRL